MKQLFITVIFTAMMSSVFASPVTYLPWDGSATMTVTPAGQVYTVTNAAQLAWIAQQNDVLNGYEGCTIRLEVHIDLQGYLWQPIGSAQHPFQGMFDGQNHLIKGLKYLQGDQAVGLFGMIGSSGQVKNIGIAGDQILAKNKSYVGSLAGVNAGSISHSWSMAEIATAGSVVGGLVGANSGSISDCYNAGLVLQATDTIGGLVGKNSGSITYCYNVGYAMNGNGVVGFDDHGSYNKVYFDRRMYYQPSGSADSHITPVDETAQMYRLFLTRNQWVKTADLYPQLSGFENYDASVASVSPVTMQQSITPEEHANDFAQTFSINTAHSQIWSVREGTASVNLSAPSACSILRSCDGGYVILAVSVGQEERLVYMSARRLADFVPGKLTVIEDDFVWCNPSLFYLPQIFTLSEAREGWIYDNYQYMITLDSVRQTDMDTIRVDTFAIGDWNTVQSWYSNAEYETTEPRHLIITLYSHDEGCAVNWQAGGHYSFEVLHEFNGGWIGETNDTTYDVSKTIFVPSIEDAAGGLGVIEYQWFWASAEDGELHSIPGAVNKNLTNYVVSQSGEYWFMRYAADELCQTDPDHLDGFGYYRLVLREPVDAGDLILNEQMETYCQPQDRLQDTLWATAPSGGSGVYFYQWYVNGEALTGANKEYLPLAAMDMQPGQTYYLTRQVKDDYRLSEWVTTDYVQQVYVSTGFTAGQIAGGNLSPICVIGGVGSIHVQIASLADATGVGTLEYAWFRADENGSNPVQVGSTAALDATFSSEEIIFGQVYQYYRMVRDADCGSSWIRSTGTTYQSYQENDHTESTLRVCSSSFPYTVMYPDPQSGPLYHTFNLSDCGVPFTFSDTRESMNCYPTWTVTLEAVDAPEIQVEEYAKLCQSEGTITIYYEVTSGCPDSFYIELSPSLKRYFNNRDFITGTMDPACAGETGKIVLSNVQRIGMGSNYMYVQVGNRRDTEGDEECFSMMHRMDLEVNLGGYIYSKYDKVLFVDNEPNTEEDYKFIRYQWYKNGVKLEGETNQYYQENGQPLFGTYYADLTTIENGEVVTYRSCDIEMPAENSLSAPSRQSSEPRLILVNDQVRIEMDGIQIDMVGRIVK